MPDDRIQIVEADAPANDRDIGVERKDEMASEVAASHADIADHANQTPSGNKNAEYVPPDLLQFSKKCFVVLNVAELVRVLVVPFQVPVWRRRDDEMDGLVRQE